MKIENSFFELRLNMYSQVLQSMKHVKEMIVFHFLEVEVKMLGESKKCLILRLEFGL